MILEFEIKEALRTVPFQLMARVIQLTWPSKMKVMTFYSSVGSSEIESCWILSRDIEIYTDAFLHQGKDATERCGEDSGRERT